MLILFKYKDLLFLNIKNLPPALLHSQISQLVFKFIFLPSKQFFVQFKSSWQTDLVLKSSTIFLSVFILKLEVSIKRFF